MSLVRCVARAIFVELCFGGRETAVEAHHELQLWMSLAQFGNARQFRGVNRQWFFDKDVFASLQGLLDHRGMLRVSCANKNRVDV